MGLLDSLFGGGSMSDPVRGTAQVVSCSANRGRGVYQACHLELVVQAEGVPATAVQEETLVHRSKWPFPGMTLPATIDRANPTNVKIAWDELPDSRDRARQTAEGMAAAMRGEGGAGGFAGAQVINLSGGELTEEQRRKLEALGITPPEPAEATPPPQGDSFDERMSRIERLAQLHADGVLTDEEFAEQKRKLLDG
jgi:Short C-terminal domain